MNKNKFAITPPMGWNSYDYYDTTVNEEQIKKECIVYGYAFEGIRIRVYCCGH